MLVDPVEQARRAGEQVHHFHGGLRLRHNKKVSCELPLEKTPLPPRLWIPLLQNTGHTAESLVSVGQKVLKGEVIGRFEDKGRGFVHASTSGIVTALARQPLSHPSGLEGPCIILKPDGLDQWIPLEPVQNWESVDPDYLLQYLEESGIVGMGGAAFPTRLKMDDARSKNIHTLILNGAECEPYNSCDEMLMRE